MAVEQAHNIPPYSPGNPPPSLEVAEARRAILGAEILDIQTQLGVRDRRSASGERLSSREYWAWHQRATYAWNKHVQEKMFLKTWAHQERLARDASVAPGVRKATLATQGVTEDDPLSVLAALYAICASFARADQPMTQNERWTIGLAYRVLKKNGREPTNDDESGA